MTRSAITLASFVLALAAPALGFAQDTTTPPSTPPAVPTDAAAAPAAVPGDQAAPAATDDDDETQQQQQPAQGTATSTTGAGESGQGLQSDMAAATADEQAETTPIPPVTPAATEEEQEEEKLPFRGSIFFWDHSYNMYGLTLPYSNPTYVWTFSFRPRWYFGDDWYAAARFDAYYELTDSDSTTTNHQLDLGDAVLSFARPKIAELEHITFGATASLTLPLSIASRANGLIAATGITGRATRRFEHVLEGLTLDASLGYSHSFNSGNTLTRDDAGAGAVGVAGTQANPITCATAQQSSEGASPEGACSGGASTVADSVTLGLTGSLSPIKRMSVDLSYTWWWRHARGLADATVIASGMPVTIEDGSLTHWRNLQVFSISVGYDVTPWLNASLSWGTLTTQLNPNGSFRNPFANPDSAVDLNLTVALDELYKVFRPTPQTTEHNPTATASNRPARSRQ